MIFREVMVYNNVPECPKENIWFAKMNIGEHISELHKP